MRRENYLYAGVDTHKESHTACVVTCWNELLLTVTIPNKPGEFHKLAKRVSKKANELGISPVYGLENVSGHGRALAVWLIENGYQVKDVNPALSYNQRKSAPTMEKNDEYDAYAVATVLINQLHKLPDAKPDDAHWTLSQLVTRRSTLVREGVRLKNGLHGQLSIAYPSYKQFFSDIDGKIATYFWKTYPSPVHLRYKTADELDGEFKVVAPRGTRGGRGSRILECVQIDGDTHREYQESRDFITQSFARGLERHTQELGLIEAQIEIMLKEFDYKLTTLPGVRTVTAGKIIAEIGDISRFKNAGKLARYAGIAPVTFSSAGKGKDLSSSQGNRLLNGVFYLMAVGLVGVMPKTRTPRHPVFREYFLRKVGEGKTKSQALVCIMRRLVNIVFSMMKNKTEYRPFVRDEHASDE